MLIRKGLVGAFVLLLLSSTAAQADRGQASMARTVRSSHAQSAAVTPTSPVDSSPIIRQIESVVDQPQFASDFAGESLNADGTVTIDVTAQGQATLSAALGQALGAAAASQYTFRVVPNSAAALKQLTDNVASQSSLMKANGIDAISWGQYVGTDTITIEVADLTPAKEAWLHQQFGGATILTVQPSSTSDLGVREANRYYDNPAFNDGLRIFVDNKTSEPCTDAFAMRGNNSGRIFQLTAGHCQGTSYWTNFDNHQEVGTLSKRYFSNNGDDFQTLTCSSCQGNVWYEGPSIGRNQGKTHSVATGHCDCNSGQVTVDGASTGETPNSNVIEVNVCHEFTDGLTTCNMNVAQNTNYDPCAIGGDSGGPVYQRAANNKAYATGTIIGTYGNDNSKCAYQRISEIINAASLSVVPGS